MKASAIAMVALLAGGLIARLPSGLDYRPDCLAGWASQQVGDAIQACHVVLDPPPRPGVQRRFRSILRPPHPERPFPQSAAGSLA
jgi:hypothetical protein